MNLEILICPSVKPTTHNRAKVEHDTDHLSATASNSPQSHRKITAQLPEKYDEYVPKTKPIKHPTKWFLLV